MLLISLIFVCSGILATTPPAPDYSLEDAALHFAQFIIEHNRHYGSEEEKQARFQIFKDNLEEIINMNANSIGVKFAINHFADLTNEEFLNTFTGHLADDKYLNDPCVHDTDRDIPDNGAPDSYDWRDHKAVTRVKDQGSCNSCYAFATIGNIEGQYAIKYGNQQEFSEQQLVDCSGYYYACAGGTLSGSIAILMQIGGSVSEDDYPYKGVEGKCQFDKSQVKIKMTGCILYDLKSQDSVKRLLYQTGPLYIVVAGLPLKNYHGGIYKDTDCDGEINHAVLLVGYGSENGTDYWIVKNSWNEGWGEAGYFRMVRGEGHHSCRMMHYFKGSTIIA